MSNDILRSCCPLHGYPLGRIDGDRSVAATDARLTALSAAGPDVLVGFHEDSRVRAYNAASYLSAGATVHVHRKLYLPNYLVSCGSPRGCSSAGWCSATASAPRRGPGSGAARG